MATIEKLKLLGINGEQIAEGDLGGGGTPFDPSKYKVTTTAVDVYKGNHNVGVGVEFEINRAGIDDYTRIEVYINTVRNGRALAFNVPLTNLTMESQFPIQTQLNPADSSFYTFQIYKKASNTISFTLLSTTGTGVLNRIQIIGYRDNLVAK